MVRDVIRVHKIVADCHCDVHVLQNRSSNPFSSRRDGDRHIEHTGIRKTIRYSSHLRHGTGTDGRIITSLLLYSVHGTPRILLRWICSPSRSQTDSRTFPILFILGRCIHLNGLRHESREWEFFFFFFSPESVASFFSCLASTPR